MILEVVRRRAILAIQSKYGLTLAVALVWVMFAADIDLVHIMRTANEVKSLHEEAHRIEAAAELVRKDLTDLMTDERSLERFARERYYMKRTNEEVYRVVNRLD